MRFVNHNGIVPGLAGAAVVLSFAFSVQAQTESFYNGAVPQGNGSYFLQFGSAPFGYYGFPAGSGEMYHFDLGYEYLVDAQDGAKASISMTLCRGTGFILTRLSSPI